MIKYDTILDSTRLDRLTNTLFTSDGGDVRRASREVRLESILEDTKV